MPSHQDRRKTIHNRISDIGLKFQRDSRGEVPGTFRLCSFLIGGPSCVKYLQTFHLTAEVGRSDCRGQATVHFRRGFLR